MFGGLMLEYPSIAALAEQEISNPLEELIDPIFVLKEQIKRGLIDPNWSEEEKNKDLLGLLSYAVGSMLRRQREGQDPNAAAAQLRHELGEAARAAQREYGLDHGQ